MQTPAIDDFDDLYRVVWQEELEAPEGNLQVIRDMDRLRGLHYKSEDESQTARALAGRMPGSIAAHFSRLLISEKAEEAEWEQLLLMMGYSIYLAGHHSSLVYVFPKGENTAGGQGFKLHVSAHLPVGRAVLTDVLPVLGQLPHKVVRNRRTLKELEQSPTQAGKFITIYPDSSRDAVELAYELDKGLADNGYSGPRIPSDRGLPNGRSGLVFYRYGASGGGKIRRPDGAWVDDVRSIDGSLAVPSWIEDPFQRK